MSKRLLNRNLHLCDCQFSRYGMSPDAERVVRRIIDVEREADLIDIEPERPLDIANRQRYHFD